MAMSGGVDSTFATLSLKEAGWDVVGVHLDLPAPPPLRRARIRRVRRLARELGVPLEILDPGPVFEKAVVRPFVEDYLGGKTPNPCVRCNALVKFPILLRYARLLGIPWVATGHYARVRREAEAEPQLWRGADPGKEQSYFLCRLSRGQLQRVLLPLGRWRKEEVKGRMKARGWWVEGAPESQEVCFLGGKDYRDFVASRLGRSPVGPGDIIGPDGRILGRHQGFYRYTIGQRHGLGIASERPYYVKALRPQQNEVVVARREELCQSEVEVCRLRWVSEGPPRKDATLTAQVRYRHAGAPGRIVWLEGDRMGFMFEEPQWALTPGQALALYQGDRLLGGGWIIR